MNKCKYTEFLEYIMSNLEGSLTKLEQTFLYNETFVYLHNGADHCDCEEYEIIEGKRYNNEDEVLNFIIGEVITYKANSYLILEILECYPVSNFGIYVKLKVRRVK